MNELENKIISKKVGCLILKIILVFGIIMIAFSIPSLIRVKRMADRMICGADLLGLGKAIKLYADDFNNGYPSPEKWCDLLIEKEDVVKKQFCPHKKKPIYSYYAINPNCDVNCPNDVVLIFETKPGWNQYGGAELLSFDNHKPKGANICFNDGYVRFVRPEDVNKLKWK